MSNSEMSNFFTEQGRTKDRRLCRDVLSVRRRQKPAENAAQWKNGHLWMDTSLVECRSDYAAAAFRRTHAGA